MVVGGAVALVSWQRWWTVIGTWVTDQSPVTLLGAWPLLPAALLLVAGFVAFRRATA